MWQRRNISSWSRCSDLEYAHIINSSLPNPPINPFDSSFITCPESTPFSSLTSCRLPSRSEKRPASYLSQEALTYLLLIVSDQVSCTHSSSASLASWLLHPQPRDPPASEPCTPHCLIPHLCQRYTPSAP